MFDAEDVMMDEDARGGSKRKRDADDPEDASATECVSSTPRARRPIESNSTLESQSQNHSQKLRMLSPKTLTYGVFYCDFGFDSQEWSCSQKLIINQLGGFYILISSTQESWILKLEDF